MDRQDLSARLSAQGRRGISPTSIPGMGPPNAGKRIRGPAVAGSKPRSGLGGGGPPGAPHPRDRPRDGEAPGPGPTSA